MALHTTIPAAPAPQAAKLERCHLGGLGRFVFDNRLLCLQWFLLLGLCGLGAGSRPFHSTLWSWPLFLLLISLSQELFVLFFEILQRHLRTGTLFSTLWSSHLCRCTIANGQGSRLSSWCHSLVSSLASHTRHQQHVGWSFPQDSLGCLSKASHDTDKHGLHGFGRLCHHTPHWLFVFFLWSFCLTGFLGNVNFNKANFKKTYTCCVFKPVAFPVRAAAEDLTHTCFFMIWLS